MNVCQYCAASVLNTIPITNTVNGSFHNVLIRSSIVLKVSVILQVLGCLEAVCAAEEGYEGQGSRSAQGSATEAAREIFQCLDGLCSDNAC